MQLNNERKKYCYLLLQQSLNIINGALIYNDDNMQVNPTDKIIKTYRANDTSAIELWYSRDQVTVGKIVWLKKQLCLSKTT